MEGRAAAGDAVAGRGARGAADEAERLGMINVNGGASARSPPPPASSADEGLGGFLSAGSLVFFEDPEGARRYAAQATEPEAACTALVPLREADPGCPPTRECIMQVEAQDGWTGFRSLSSGGRYLQVGRKARGQMRFFNRFFGVWEQYTSAPSLTPSLPPSLPLSPTRSLAARRYRQERHRVRVRPG